MLALIALGTVVAMPAPPAKGADVAQIPVEHATVAAAQMRMPVSDSIRAATWDELLFKPAGATKVRLACIVWNANGAPGACVSASLLQQGQKTMDWAKARDDQDQADRTDDPAAVALRRTAERRLHAALLPAKPETLPGFTVRVFEETISPADARAPFVANRPLVLRDVTMAKPLDGELIQDLYPTVALRYDVVARVSMSCLIEPTLKLLCRDLGSVQIISSDGQEPEFVIEALRFATYQMASTIQLMPKDKDGRDIVGRNLQVGTVWQLPD